jgi:hypothetical protein
VRCFARGRERLERESWRFEGDESRQDEEEQWKVLEAFEVV